MANLHLICGLPGSGKSTLAERLAEEPSTIWLSPDEWMARIVGDGYDSERRAAVESLQWDLAKRLLRVGINVVLDNGFWSKAERSFYREEAAALGAATKVHFLDVPLVELNERVAKRNLALPPNAFPVSEADLSHWERLFERPDAEELTDTR